MMIRKFRDHKYAQATIHEYDDGSMVLVSYVTPVVTVDAEGWLTVHGLYSRTTIKHIGWFMRELGFNYHDAKWLYYDHKAMNIHTAELIDRD